MDDRWRIWVAAKTDCGFNSRQALRTARGCRGFAAESEVGKQRIEGQRGRVGRDASGDGYTGMGVMNRWGGVDRIESRARMRRQKRIPSM